MKRMLALLLTLAMVLCLASTETAAAFGGKDAAQDALENTEDIDNSVIRPSIAIAYKSVTSLSCWGTNNDTPGN